MAKVRVVMCPAERAPYITNVSDTLENLQRIVGGYIETLTMTTDAVIVCNEEGRLWCMPENHSLPVSGFVGDCLIMSYNSEGEAVNMEEQTARFLMREGKKRFCEWQKAGAAQ